jgi:hypothetical protein
MKRTIKGRALILVLLFALSAPSYTLAQVNAIVGGTVSDATGALIPGVEVTAKNINTGIVATRVTNETGAYDFPSLQPGTYAVSAALPGFRSSAYNNVQLGQGSGSASELHVASGNRTTASGSRYRS